MDLFQGWSPGSNGIANEKVAAFSPGCQITSVDIYDIAEEHSPETFQKQLSSWGLADTYDFFYLPVDKESKRAMGVVYINFFTPQYASMCYHAFEASEGLGSVEPADIQGMEANWDFWSNMAQAEELCPKAAPQVFPHKRLHLAALQRGEGSQPPQETSDQEKYAPQIREQFHKTKLCFFHKRNMCALGLDCPFAHSRLELQHLPNLTKTKLCYNFLRGRCTDENCKHAHGYQELRATEIVYKTEMCQWWITGNCKAGMTCRYAHGECELNSVAAA